MLGHSRSVLMGPADFPFDGGGGGGALPSPSPFVAPGGIPDPRNATAGVPGTVGLTELINSGKISAEELLQLVAALAGIGGGVPAGGAQPPGNSIEQAFASGGGAPGGGGAPQIPGLPL